MSSTWDIVLGAALGLAGSVTGGFISTRAAWHERTWDARRAAYSAWIKAISEAARLAERAQKAPSEENQLAAEEALDAAVPFMVGLTVAGAPSGIFEGAQNVHRFIRQVRRNDAPSTEMQRTLHPVVELIRADATAPTGLFGLGRRKAK